jgi:ABC-type bacteriocin/lantibiotic exporter with double-glycine peptidase domain
MVDTFFGYLKRGLSRKSPQDPIGGAEGSSDFRTLFEKLYPFVRRRWSDGLLGLLLIVLTSLLAFPQPLITRYLIDDAIVAGNLKSLATGLLLLVVIALANRLTTLFQGLHFIRLEQEVTVDIRQELLARVLRFPKSFFDRAQTGYLMARLSSDVQGLGWFFSDAFVKLVCSSMRVVGGAVLLLYLEWRLALGVLILIPGVVLGMRYFSAKLRVLSQQNMEQQARASTGLQESLSVLPLIKAHATEDRSRQRLASDLRAALNGFMEAATVRTLANLIVSSLPSFARFTALAVGAYWVIRDQWSLGSLFAFQAYLAYVFGPAQFLASAHLQLQTALAALERVSVLLAIIPEDNVGHGYVVRRLRGGIEFERVCFAYDGREQVLRDISFHVHPGEHLAIIGPSGAGKTTLLHLIIRFYKPSSGEIYFDGRSVSSYEVGSLRRRIGYVSQMPLFMSGTIMENLSFGNPLASAEQVVSAARCAGIHAFISSLPAGYMTEIGELAVDLSAGQRQRLAIARALVKDPDILVLDEPTSAIDSATEEEIFHQLSAVLRHKTIVVVSHRLPTISELNRILRLDGSGRIATDTLKSLRHATEHDRFPAAHQTGEAKGSHAVGKL